ncbi:MAG: hypothetical protein JSW20_12315 [Nitrospiraceae bacterium]|nr:MAG: hypothetical protein JSW20_12315 [Nitrospiraceae bacterium]
MSNNFNNCPYCGKKVMKGAMRCVACGKIQQTPEEQAAAIEKLQSRRKFNFKKFLNRTVAIMIIGVLYYYFSDRLIEIIKNTLGI